MNYPETRRGDVVDVYHGESVADPYRWLEDPDAPETAAWVAAQNRLTRAFLDATPARAAIEQRLKQLWNYERYGLPVKRGGRYFYTRNDGLQNQSVLYVADAVDGPARVLLDPNTLSPDGTTALTGFALSDDGRWLAYGLAKAGSDWQSWRVREVATGRDLDDVLEWIKFSGAAWTHDGLGFFYSRYDEPAPGEQLTAANYYQKLYYHRLGTPQSADRLILERRDEKEWGFSGEVTEDGRYLIVSVWKGTDPRNQIFYADLAAAGWGQPAAPGAAGGDTTPPLPADAPPIVELLTGFDARYEFVGHAGNAFFFRTDRDAPRHRLVAIDPRRPEPAAWRVVLAETDDNLESAHHVGGRFVAVYVVDAASVARVVSLDGQFQRDVPLEGLGSFGGFGGRADDPETFFAFTSFTVPTTIYRFDVATGAARIVRRPQVDFRPEDYETRRVFVTSADGTRVPLFLTHRRGLKPNGNLPTLLYGYGGFDIALLPGFSSGRVLWLEQGGVYAQACLRGGGEYGRAWHDAGRLKNKQRVFDDFIAAAEWLVREGYTRPARLAISGRSNGGLLVGAALTQRPELFGAAVPGVGVLDMLRFHKFTIGWAWVSEFGSADDPAMYPVLRAYSPLHNLRPGVAYPATLVITADHDDRVVPAHSFKFTAALQQAQGGAAPILARIETRAGHGAGTATTKQIEELADTYAFLVRALGLDWFASASGASRAPGGPAPSEGPGR